MIVDSTSLLVALRQKPHSSDIGSGEVSDAKGVGQETMDCVVPGALVEEM